MSKLSYKDLTDKMIAFKTSVTQNWDILCSYDEDKVNDIFRREHAKNPEVSSTDFEVKQQSTYASYNLKYHLNLGNPSIKFLNAQSGQCQVNFSIADGSTIQNIMTKPNPDPDPIPSGYNISMTVPLVNLSGDTVKKSGEVIIFDNPSKEQSVVLHFDTNSGIGDTILYYPSTEDHNTKFILSNLITGFKDNIKDVDYVINTVRQNVEESKIATNTGVKLTPKSFIFTTTKENANASLSVWIQTNESGNNQGNMHPVFQIDSNEYSPIPQNCTSSIIFNQAIIEKLLINNISKLEALDSKISEGIIMHLKCTNENFNKKCEKVKIDGNSRQSYHTQELVIDYNLNPITIQLLRNKISMKWDWKQTITYDGQDVDSYPGCNQQLEVTNYKGSFEIKASLNKTYDIIVTNSNIQLPMKIEKGDIDTEIEFKGTGTNWFVAFITPGMEMGSRKNTTIEKDIKNSLSNINVPEISLQELNYFSEANIIFNEQVFKPKDISVCGDILIVGNLEG